MKIQQIFKKDRAYVNTAIRKYLLSLKTASPKDLYKSLNHSMLSGGKRIRPILMLTIADMLGKDKARVLAFACAVELLHTSTLILDDLPCMDNSNLRRGVPSTHIKFSESTAILASYALEMLAFDLMVKDLGRRKVNILTAKKLISSISGAMGVAGVTAGQFEDLKTKSKRISKKAIKDIHFKKTASLFISCCEMAGLLCDAKVKELNALKSYGRNLGLAFQMADDILSVTVSDGKLGKHTKQDKTTLNFINIFGMKKAKETLHGYVQDGKRALSVFNERAGILRDLLEFAGNRRI